MSMEPHNLFNGFSNDKYLGSQEILSCFIFPLIAYMTVSDAPISSKLTFKNILIILADLLNKRKYLDIIF